MKKLIALLAGCALFAPLTAFAQEWEKAEGQVRESIPAAPFIAGAYGIIWLGVFVYIAVIARKLGRVRAEMDDLRRKIERQTPR